MDPNALEQAWRSQQVPRVTVDAESLLGVIKRNRRESRAAILRRDALEIGVALAMTVFFANIGLHGSWSWLVMAAACLFIALFMLFDRHRQRRLLPSTSETVAAWLERSRLDVEHQVWLLKNIFWWYLLPPMIGMIAVMAQHVWLVRGAGPVFLVEIALGAVMLAVFGVVYWAVYWLNQRRVRKELLPRLEEFRALAESLTGRQH